MSPEDEPKESRKAVSSRLFVEYVLILKFCKVDQAPRQM